jgi:hypothetical protein
VVLERILVVVEYDLKVVPDEVVEGEVVDVEVVEGEVVVCEPEPDPPPPPEPDPPAARASAAVPTTKVPARAIVRRCFIVICKAPLVLGLPKHRVPPRRHRRHAAGYNALAPTLVLVGSKEPSSTFTN